MADVDETQRTVRLSEDVHSLAYQLHPSVLEELGLGEALRAECERRGRRSRLELSVDLDPLPGDLAKDPRSIPPKRLVVSRGHSASVSD